MATPITTEQIKSLRDESGVSIMQCKKALEEAGGDREKALIILRKKGGDIAAKKSDRTLGAGVVASYVHSNGSVGAMVELSCETDFVAKNEEFKQMAYDIAMHVAALSPLYLKEEEVNEEEKTKAREVFAKEVVGKPAEMQEKIMSGKLASFFGEKTLLEQPFIKNEELTVKGLVEAGIQKFGEKVEIARFVRFSVLGK
ncbi:MAG: elongation factor Ts [Candidatus Taylorbacteria bacterium]|nr:elongation factor Ts [Candidatus Taylorbacteria bacterium]